MCCRLSNASPLTAPSPSTVARASAYCSILELMNLSHHRDYEDFHWRRYTSRNLEFFFILDVVMPVSTSECSCSLKANSYGSSIYWPDDYCSLLPCYVLAGSPGSQADGKRNFT